MTYSLFEFIKEKFDELIEEQPNEPEKLEVEKICITDQEPQVLIRFYNMKLMRVFSDLILFFHSILT